MPQPSPYMAIPKLETGDKLTKFEHLDEIERERFIDDLLKVIGLGIAYRMQSWGGYLPIVIRTDEMP